MTSPTPSTAEMQKLLEEWQEDVSRDLRSYAKETGGEYLALKEQKKIDYIRTLEREHAAMKKGLEILEYESAKHPDFITPHYIETACEQILSPITQ